MLFILALLPPLASQEAGNQGSPRQNKVVVFQFKDYSTSRDYAYYSYIIPDSIAVELRRRNAFSVQTFPVTLDYISERDGEDKRRNHVLYLSGKGRELSADYTVSGMFEVRDNKINIKSQIFNVAEQRILGIEETSSELGALIFLIIDNLTAKINTEIGKTQAAEVKKAEEAEDGTAKSPFIPVYNAMRGTVLGAEHGKLYFRGEWSDIYRDTDHYAFNVRYGLGNVNGLKNTPVLKDSALALNYHYMTALPNNMSSSLIIWGFSLGYIYEYPVMGDFKLSVEGDAGMMFTTLRLFDPFSTEGGGPREPLEEMESTDIMTRLLFAAGYEFAPIVFRTGFSLNRIWYSDKPMDYVALVFGLGFRI